MNDRIAYLIAGQLINLGFISRTSGCIQVLKRGKYNFPASLNVYQQNKEGEIVCPKTEDYTPMIPDSSETGIIYFEDKGSNNVSRSARRETWVGTLNLVCWLNLTKIGVKEPGLLQEAVMSNLVKEIPNSGYLIGGKLEASKVLPKTPNPFQSYSYEEEKTQFVTFPYDYFSLELKYRVFTLPNCPITIQIQPIVC